MEDCDHINDRNSVAKKYFLGKKDMAFVNYLLEICNADKGRPVLNKQVLYPLTNL